MTSKALSPHELRIVAFDFDGVILETTSVKTEAFAELFAAYPEHLEDILEYHQSHVGHSRIRKFQWIYEQILHMPYDSTVAESLGTSFAELVVDKALRASIVSGAVELLACLRRRIVTVVASGTPQEELEHLLEGHGLRGYFEIVRGAPTPKEQILSEALAELELLPSQLLMVGDGFSDYQAAMNVGASFVLRETPEQLRFFEDIDVVRVRDLHELGELIRAGRISRRPSEES